MNLLPVPPDSFYEPIRSRDLTMAVSPARKVRQAAEEREQVARDQASGVLDVVQREALLAEYVAHADTYSRQVPPAHPEQQSQRAISAYESVALQDKRDILADMLGVNEYA